MKSFCDSFEKLEERGIEIKPIIIEKVGNKTLKKFNNNILEIDDYLNQAKTAFLHIIKENTEETVSILLNHIDNFNNIINKKDIFNIEDILKNDFENIYLIEKNKKESQLINKYNTIDKFISPSNSKESFEDFINKQNIDFSFEKIDKNRLNFYQSLDEFDKIYDLLINEKDFKVDSSIFKYPYYLLIAKKRMKK